MPSRLRALLVVTALLATAVAAPAARAVVNGARVPEGGRPFMAALLDGGSQICGGSVAAPDLVVTAAHCVADGDASGLSVSVGAVDYGQGTEIDVVEVIVHPDFEDDASADIALLRLGSDAPVSPIALAGPGDDPLEAPGSPAVVAGWGSRVPLIGQFPPLDRNLREVELNVVADGDWRCRTPSPDNQLCASDFLEDSCQGDSGGPLFADLPGGEVQIGIVSSGLGCAVPGFAGYYTEINGPAIAGFLHAHLGSPGSSPRGRRGSAPT